MIRLLAGRTLYYVSVLLALSLFTFLLFNVLPADPARIILGIQADEQAVAQLRHKLGLDRPLPEQYVSFVADAVRFQLGRSYADDSLVSRLLIESLDVTARLCLLSLTLAVSYSVLVNSCYYAGRLRMLRRAFAWTHMSMISMPVFFSGIVLALVFGYWLPVFPLSGFTGGWYYLVLPSVALALYPAVTLARVLEESLAGVLAQPYIRTAHALGLSSRRVLCKYGLKNALIPWVSVLSNQLAVLLAGAFIVETVFSLPGLGQLVVKAILRKDFPVLQGVVMLNGALFILLTIGTDIVYLLLDPRIRTHLPRAS